MSTTAYYANVKHFMRYVWNWEVTLNIKHKPKRMLWLWKECVHEVDWTDNVAKAKSSNVTMSCCVKCETKTFEFVQGKICIVDEYPHLCFVSTSMRMWVELKQLYGYRTKGWALTCINKCIFLIQRRRWQL